MNGVIKNTNLDDIFQNNPEHVNNEHVYEAKTKKKPLYIDPLFTENNELLSFLESNLVTIITPDTIEAVRKKVKQENIKILQSCYENGRVLESDQKIIIDGIEYTVVIKGVGTTGYYRETGAINPWINLINRSMPEEKKEQLKNFPFYETAGTYDMDKALLELERSKMLQEMGIDTEKVLGIYELEEILGKNGEYISIEQLEKDQIITENLRPVILIRAHKTNFRLLDYVMLDKYKRRESINPLIDHVLEKSEKYWGTTDINQYLGKLIETILGNRLNLIGKFSKLNGETWQDVFRNFSVFGEELDLGTMQPMRDNWQVKSPHNFLQHYSTKLETIFIGLNHIIKIIEQYTNYKIDHQKLADSIWNIIISWIKENKDELKKHYQDNNWKDQSEKNFLGTNKEYDFKDFLNYFFQSCFSFFIDYGFNTGYAKIIKDKLNNI